MARDAGRLHLRYPSVGNILAESIAEAGESIGKAERQGGRCATRAMSLETHFFTNSLPIVWAPGRKKCLLPFTVDAKAEVNSLSKEEEEKRRSRERRDHRSTALQEFREPAAETMLGSSLSAYEAAVPVTLRQKAARKVRDPRGHCCPLQKADGKALRGSLNVGEGMGVAKLSV